MSKQQIINEINAHLLKISQENTPSDTTTIKPSNIHTSTKHDIYENQKVYLEKYSSDKQRNYFYNTKVSGLSYNVTSSFFTDKFSEEISNILGSSTDLKKQQQLRKKKFKKL